MDAFSHYYLYFTVFISGATVLILEILGTRIIAPFFGSTIFVWSSLITITLGALALGYFIGGKLVDKHPSFNLFYFIFIIAGILIYFVVIVDQQVLVFADRFGLKWGPLVTSLILFSLPLFTLGMVSPFAIRLQAKFIKNIGATAGRIYGFGTVGSMIGALLAGFFLIPHFTLTEIFKALGLILIALSLIGLTRSKSWKELGVYKFLLIPIFLAIAFAPDKLVVEEPTKTMKVLHQEASFYGDIKIIEARKFHCMVVDGGIQSCLNFKTKAPIFTYIGEIGRLVKEREISNLLLLGVAGGNALYNIPDSVSVDMVEIDPQVIKIASDFLDFKVGANQSLFIDDARRFLRTTNKKYDLIMVDISLGNISPIHIFSEESFELMKAKLNPNGYVLLHIEGRMGEDDIQLSTTMKTASQVFPTVKLTTTDPEHYTSVLLHLSADPSYTFSGGGRFVEVSPNYSDSIVMSDENNYFDVISVPKLALILEEMKIIGGYKILFSL